MTCLRMGNAIVCISPWGRLRLGNRYVWVDFHEYCGPSFYWDSANTKPYEFQEDIENDPIWPIFEKWLEKYNREKERIRRKK